MMFDRSKKNMPAENHADYTARTLVLILIHAAVMLCILLFCDVKYEVSDDFVMELIASGTFNGTPDAHLMFCSYLWGLFLNVFYGLFSGISWYFWTLVAVGFLSCCAISYYLAHSVPFPLAVLITALIAAFFSGDLYLLPQFTKTAAVAIASGGFLFVWGLFHQRKKGCVLGGAALVVVGCLIRHNGIYVVGVYLLIYVLLETGWLFRRETQEDKREMPEDKRETPEARKDMPEFGRKTLDFRKKIVRIYAAGGLLILLVFVLRWGNRMAYDIDEDYRYYTDYSYVRAYIVDYPLPDYSVCASELEGIGISENDYQLIRSWSFGDQEVFSLERMQEVLSIVDKYRPVPFATWKEVGLRLMERGVLHYPGMYCFLALAVISLCLSWKRLGVIVPMVVVTAALMFYFIYIGHGVYRVEIGYLFAACMVMIYTLPRRNLKNLSYFTYLPYILAVLVLGSQIKNYLPDQSYVGLSDEEYREYIDTTFDLSWDYLPEKYTKCVNRRDIRPDFLREVKEHPENLYLLDFNTTIQSFYYEFSPFESLPKGYLGNMIYLGGVTVNHPVIKETLEKWNVEKELPGLLKENVYFVSNTTSEFVLKYLQEHYDADTSMTLYKIVDGYEIWSYQSETSASSVSSAS